MIRVLVVLVLLGLATAGVFEVVLEQKFHEDILGLHNHPLVVRQELRQLSSARLDRVINAMWTLRRVAGDEGRAKYGPGYLSYDEFVAQHWYDVSHLKCQDETTHQGMLFGIYHRLLVREFEMVLSLVTGHDVAVPFWDVAMDITTEGVLADGAHEDGNGNNITSAATPRSPACPSPSQNMTPSSIPYGLSDRLLGSATGAKVRS